MRADRINRRANTARVRFTEPNAPTIVRTPRGEQAPLSP